MKNDTKFQINKGKLTKISSNDNLNFINAAFFFLAKSH